MHYMDNVASNTIAMETMSAMLIEDRAAMAMADIPRAGIKAIRIDNTTTLVVY